MLVLALLLAQAAAAVPVATPATAVPLRPPPLLGRSGEPARGKSLAEHAAEMKAKGTPVARVSFDDVRKAEPSAAREAPPAAAGTRGGSRAKATRAGSGDDADASDAQRKMDRAVARGLEVPERTSASRRDRARREWDDAAEACRQTPGCVPRFRDDALYGEDKPLKTDQELIEEIRRRGFSEPHPLPK